MKDSVKDSADLAFIASSALSVLRLSSLLMVE